MHPKVSVAYFITSHGFGHAARAAAVMQAMREIWPFVHFEIFGNTPEWFFRDTLDDSFTCHRQPTDIGMVQASALEIDLPETIHALTQFFPPDEERIECLADAVCASDCRLIVCDISPLGLAVGKRAGIPTVLIENFTWDWIYRPFASAGAGLEHVIQYLESVFMTADCHIQVAPVCRPVHGARKMPLVCRKPRTPRNEVRKRLGIGEDRRMMLITMGGNVANHGFIGRLHQWGDSVHFVVPGNNPDLPPEGETRGNVTLLPHRSIHYHPDLVHAADAVVGKAGYSTVAEVCAAGVPFGYLLNPEFAESEILGPFIDARMPSIRMEKQDFESGRWIARLPDILELPKASPKCAANGAEEIAVHLCRWLSEKDELLEVVDTEGCTVGAAPRCRIHGNNAWLHRVVHVLVFDSKQRLLLQKRSMTKRVAPGRWDTSVGGHVDCGESVEEAVFRETGEELGFRPDSLKFAYSYIHSNDFESELVFTYICRYDGPVRWNPEEIDEVRYWEPREIDQSLGRQILSDNFEDEYRRFCSWSECAN